MAIEVVRNGADDFVGVAWCLIAGAGAVVVIGAVDTEWQGPGIALQVLVAAGFGCLASQYRRRGVEITDDTVRVRWWFTSKVVKRSDVVEVLWDESFTGWATLVTRDGSRIRCPISRPRRRVGAWYTRGFNELSKENSTTAFDRLCVLLENFEQA
jgi:hypothetical protein